MVLNQSRHRALYRGLEILPGVLVWITFISAVLGSAIVPTWVGFFAIVYYIYWLLKVIYLSIHLATAYRTMRQRLKTNWVVKLANLHPKTWQKTLPGLKFSHDLWHVVALPMYQEGFEILRETLLALSRTDYPKQRLIVSLGVEARAGEADQTVAQALQKEFAGQFGYFVVATHPANLAGEVAGKGSNETWLARQIYKNVIQKNKIPVEHITYSALDSDTQLDPGYFSLLTYQFLTASAPHQQSYQPVAFFSNNIWQAPAIARVVAFSGTYWNIIQQERPHRQLTFSSHSMSFKTLVAVDFKVTDAISDDSRIFWQCFFAFKTEYAVASLYYPAHMDANVAKTFWRTMRNQYLQQRRWAWGASDLAYAGTAFKSLWPELSIKQRWHGLKRLTAAAAGYYSWATSSLLIFFLGWLPSWFGGPAYNQTVFSYNLPQITQTLALIASLAIILQVFITLQVLPPKPTQYGRHRYILMVLQWLLLPITMNLLGAVPAIDAQTRLMLGQRLGFWPTEKHRKI